MSRCHPVMAGTAFFEYCLALPANRIGGGACSAARPKAIQEVLTLTVFAGFPILCLGQRITTYHAIGFALIALGAWFVFRSPTQPAWSIAAATRQQSDPPCPFVPGAT